MERGEGGRVYREKWPFTISCGKTSAVSTTGIWTNEKQRHIGGVGKTRQAKNLKFLKRHWATG